MTRWIRRLTRGRIVCPRCHRVKCICPPAPHRREEPIMSKFYAVDVTYNDGVQTRRASYTVEATDTETAEKTGREKLAREKGAQALASRVLPKN